MRCSFSALLFFVGVFFSGVISAAQVQIRIATGDDDAEQSLTDGTMYLGSEGSSSGFLELGYYIWRRDIGLRFQNVAIPQGSTINSAVVELTASATDSSNTRLTVTAEAVDNAAVFTSANNNISSRTPTAFNVDWNVSNWSNGNAYQTPDITSAVQEIVSRGGWSSGNSMVVIIGPDNACSNSNCDRRAEEYESGASDAALLIIDYAPPIVPEHFAISHDGAADNCTAESVTISKHDVSHAVDATYTGTITLSTSTGNGAWSLITGSGTLTDLGSGDATYVYVGTDNGQVELGLANSVAETLNINISDGTFSEYASEDSSLIFSSGGTSTYRDEFNAISFSGSDSTGSWATDWLETGEADDAGAGDLQVIADQGSNRLRIEGSGLVKELERRVDLTGATSATLTFDYRRASLDNGSEYVSVEIYNNGSSSWDELDRIKGPQNDAAYQAASYDITAYISANTQIRFVSSSGMDVPFFFFYDRVFIDDVQISADAPAVCPSTDHFDIDYIDGFGISCVPEPVSVAAKLVDGTTTDTSFTGTITLDTQSSTGSWSLNTGNGTFTDATADDGIATYTFDSTDNGLATFDLNYQSGTGSIDVDVYEGAIRDDDTEGNLTFTPNGFTVTATPLAVPFLGVVNTDIPAQIAAKDFTLYLAAYGQTPANPTCGIIESYTGAKDINFWSSYNNPVTGTFSIVVDGASVQKSEAASVAQAVTFTNGQASVIVNYADAGQITLAMKDDATGNLDLPNGIAGASQPITMVPAGLCVESTDLNADCVAGDESCSAFVPAGQGFNFTVKAVAWDGDTDYCTGNATTPNFQLSSIALSQNLIAPAAGVPGSLGTTSFDMLAADNGAATVIQTISEVGVFTITATPPLLGYFGETIAASASANIGRFYPDHFVTLPADGSFNNTCTTFNYLGQSFDYLTNPTVEVTAENFAGVTTDNYTGAWAKLDASGVSLTYPLADGTQLDENGITPIVVTPTTGTLSRTDIGNGKLRFTLGGATPDSFVYDRSAGQVAPFTSDLTIQLTAVSDGEAAASDLVTSKDIKPNGNLQRFGRGYAQDVHGTMSQVGESLTMSVGAWYFDAGGVWVQNTGDSCSSYAYVKVDNDITTTIPVLSASPFALSAGVGDLVMTISADAGSTGGTSVITTTWPSWLQYDIDGTDQLGDGNFYDDNPSATATFGIFRGDDHYLFWRESP